MEASMYYDRWDDEKGEEYSDRWFGKQDIGVNSEYSGNRSCKILLQKDGFMAVDIINDYFFGNALKQTYLYKDGFDQHLKASDLSGTWVSTHSSGTKVGVYVFSGSNYSRWAKTINASGGDVEEAYSDSGTWSYSKGVVSFKSSTGWGPATQHVYLDGGKLYIGNTSSLGFSILGYEYVKQ